MTDTVKPKKENKPISKRFIICLLIFCGLIGFLASFVLSIEKIELIKDPTFIPSCDLSPLLSCGSVMSKPQAEIFGFPNPFLGVVGFGVVATIGMAMLAGASFRRWFWLGLQAGVIFGIGLILWLQFQSIYVIGALCPYCMVVWAVMIPIFLFLTLYNFQQKHIRVPRQINKAVESALRYRYEILALWYILIIYVITERFWDYWRTLIF